MTDIMSKEQTAGASGALYHGGASRSGGHVREPKNWVACWSVVWCPGGA